MRFQVDWQFVQVMDAYRRALTGHIDFSYGRYRRDYWFFERIHSRNMLHLCNPIWAFQDELELGAEMLALAKKHAEATGDSGVTLEPQVRIDTCFQGTAVER